MQKVKHFISLIDYTHEELVEILDRADYLANAWKEGRMPKNLTGKQIGIWFYGNGFRNRLAFEIGAKEMGAHVSYIPGELGKEEPLEDIGYYLQNWYSLLIIRAKRHEDLLHLSKYINIPVVNGRTNVSHPCEIMGDLQFIRLHRGSLEELNVVFVGEVTNLCMSWFEAAVRFPIKVTQIAPAGYEAKNELIKELNLNASGKISVSNDLDIISDKTDLIYTDCWPCWKDQEEKTEIERLFLPYQITSKHLSALKGNAVFLPCPPVTRGQEVSAEAMNSERCLSYKAKEYLLHSQNAILEMLIADM
jgi:ornithine carbamoyltransferase